MIEDGIPPDHVDGQDERCARQQVLGERQRPWQRMEDVRLEQGERLRPERMGGPRDAEHDERRERSAGEDEIGTRRAREPRGSYGPVQTPQVSGGASGPPALD